VVFPGRTHSVPSKVVPVGHAGCSDETHSFPLKVVSGGQLGDCEDVQTLPLSDVLGGHCGASVDTQFCSVKQYTGWASRPSRVNAAGSIVSQTLGATGLRVETQSSY